MKIFVLLILNLFYSLNLFAQNDSIQKTANLENHQSSEKLFYNHNSKLNKTSNLIALTAEEKTWIKNNPIMKYSEINWKPLSIIENNKMSGIMGDFLDIVAQRTGIKFEYVPSTSWLHVLEQFKEGKIDLVPGIGSSPQEKSLGTISKMYAKYPMVIVTNNDFTYLKDLSDLKNNTIAVPKYYTSYNFIVKNYPHIKIIPTETISEALLLVQEKKAAAFVGHIATSLYYISELHLKDLKVSGTTQFNFEHHYLLQKNNPILLSIINKTFDSITHQDKKNIYSRWVQTTKIEKSVDYTLVIIVTLFFTIVIILVTFWNLRLKHEVEKRKEVEKMLKSANEKFSALYKLSPLGLVLTDMDGNYIEFNGAFEKICGYTKEELKTLNYWELTPKKYEKDELAQLQMIKETGAYGPYEKEYIQKNGTYIPINLNGMLIENSEGKKYIWSIVEDITTRKRDEKIISQQSNLASMGEMIGNIAHQWRQPLSVISTGATGLKLQKEFDTLDDEVFLSTCDAINNNAQYLSKTIDDFTNFIKGDRQKENFNLEDNINSFLSLVDGTIKSHNINIVLDLDKSIEIKGYRNELTQCLLNIFNNAKDALCDTQLENKIVFIKTYKVVNHIIIEIQDNAGGINNNVINRIFEPYFTTKHQKHGTGLGLHMTYNLIVEGMNGEIVVNNQTYRYDNKEYVGALFSITLPIS